jgi:peptide/nickel transport system substrate-binding protein
MGEGIDASDRSADSALSGNGDGRFTRRDALRVVAGGALAATTSSILAACGGSSHTSTAATTSESIRHGGTLRVGAITGGTAETLNPAKAITIPDGIRIYALYDGLYIQDSSGVPVPALAESGEHDGSGRVWTFRLRDGVAFHNGRPLSAEDLLYTIHTWSLASSSFYSVMAPIIDFGAVRKRDNLTVEVPLKRPIAELPSLLVYTSAAVIPVDFTDFSHPIGTGPFKYESFTPGQQSVFSANPTYWVHDQPHVDALVVNSSFAEDTARTNALLSGAIDYAPQLPYTFAREYASSGDAPFILSQATGPQVQYFYMRVDSGPTKDVRVRQAMRLLTNRTQMIEDSLSGFGGPGNDLTGYTLPHFGMEFTRPYDPEQARALLKAAGQENLHLQLKTAPVTTGFVESATLLKQQAAGAGVSIDLITLPASNFYTASGGYLTNQFSQDYWTQMPSLTAFYLQTLITGAPYNTPHWGSPAEDEMIFDAVAATDPAAAEQRWHAVQAAQFASGGLIVWDTEPWIDGHLPHVEGVGATHAGFADAYNFRSAWLSA